MPVRSDVLVRSTSNGQRLYFKVMNNKLIRITKKDAHDLKTPAYRFRKRSTITGKFIKPG